MSSSPKAFQEVTSRAAIKTLTGKGLRRFLIADEVGLGKTLVASQVILGMARRRGGRLTVFYVTSGRTVAGQNKGRLLDFGDDEPISGTVSLVDRLGLIPSEPAEAPLRLYAFSPATSFPAAGAKASLGQVRERAFLYRLLLATYPGLAGRMPIDPFRGRAHRMWPGEHRLAIHKKVPTKLRAAYRSALAARLGRGIEKKLASGAKSRPHASFMTDLRLALAHAALILAEPDLIIFDEFQCYRDLLLNQHGAQDHVRRTLINGSGDVPPAMLLLSATPYRLADDHKGKGTTAHEEFHELLGFLGGASLKGRSEQLLERYRPLLAQIANTADGPASVAVAEETHEVRHAIEGLLAPIMSRTERDDPADDMDRSTKPVETGLKPVDLDLFRSLAEGVSTSDSDQTDRTGSRSDALAYWLSVPLAAQALGPSYKFWTRGTFKTARNAPRLTQANRYAEPRSGWGSPKLRGLTEIVSPESLALPWVAPSLTWWELGTRWRQHGLAPKALVFSKYRATPQSIAALMSLEVERRHLGSKSYRKAWVTKRLSSRTNTIFNLFHASPFLVAAVDPLASPCANQREVKALARRQLIKALAALGISSRPRRRVDARRHRPSWRVLAAIEAVSATKRMKSPLDPTTAATLLAAGSEQLLADDPGTSQQVEARESARTIACVSKEELTDLVNLALGSPAVVTTRAFSRHFDSWSVPEHYRRIVSLCWGPLRRYLDNPIFWAALPGDDIEPQIRDAIIEGNFEALLDEHIWTRKASLPLDKLVGELATALGLGTGSFTFQGIPKAADPIGVRCHAALPFAGAQADTTRLPKRRKADPTPSTAAEEKEGPPRSETIRTAFNSPFWPHLLSTTSVGQEGLDFHNWCDQVVHWDLCSSPVDLEQREGRIQRFGSLTIRRALARDEGEVALAAAIGAGTSPWVELKRLAEVNHSDDAGLSPWWTLPNARVRRYLFSLPGGRDALSFRRLQDRRLLYRLALGQPNPEDFMASLHRDGAAVRLKPFLLNLSAYYRVQVGRPAPDGSIRRSKEGSAPRGSDSGA